MAVFYTYRFNAVDLAGKLLSSAGISAVALAPLRAIEVAVVTASALAENDKAAMDQYMLERGYTFKRMSNAEAIFYTNTPIGQGTQILPAGSVWSVFYRVLTSPLFFATNPAKVFAQVVGRIKTNGADAELRMVEEAPDGSEVVVGQWTLADTGNAWQTVRYPTTVAPRAGDNIYRVEGRANSTASAELDAASITLLESPL